jgi:hypothetical protein
MKEKILTIAAITLILFAVFAPISGNLPAVYASNAELTGVIYDYGSDTDADGLFNFLVVEVEVNVVEAGYYTVQVNALRDVYYNYFGFYSSNTTYLDVGVQNVSLSFSGIKIYAYKFNPKEIYSVYLYDEYYQTLDYRGYILLSKTYNYALFDTGAVLTGTLYDEGVDTDSDGLYNYLKVGVEINVSDAALYEVCVSGLVNASYYYIDGVYNYTEEYLSLGIHVLNVLLHGAPIYASHATNISMVNSIDLYISEGYGYYQLEYRSYLNLSSLYNYSEFESPAYFTGIVSDRGVDVDGDGLFDYLEIGIEINVTEAGKYEVYVGDLLEQVGGSTRYLYYPQSIEDYFDVGNQTVYLNYEGSRLAYERFSPTNISSINLYEPTYPYVQLGYIASAPLSRKYNYTLFNAPLKDMQVNFIVYPNGTMGVDGTFNFTHMYPQNMGPQMNTTLSISTTEETTRGSVNGTIVFPKDGMFRWPYDSTTANFASQYNNGLLNATLDATLFMPPEGRTTYPTNASDFSFNSTYSNGLLNAELWGETEIPLFYRSMFPLNITDFTVFADYIGNEIEGNITFHALPGFTLGDIRVYFNGNKTDLYLRGNVNVTYGNFLGIEINSTTLEQMLAEFNNTIPGPTGLVHNATWGLLECTQLNTTKVDWTNGLNGTDIEYNVTIHGNFTGFFARLLAEMINPYNPEQAYPTIYAALDSVLSTANASLLLNYYHTSGITSLDLHLASDVKALWSNALQLIPLTMPPEYRTQVEALLKIANATAYAIQGFSFNASYSSTAQKLDLDAWLLENTTQLENDIIPILPGIYPPPLREIVKSYINTTYCTLTSSNTTFTYTNGTGNFDIKWVLQGDLKAQINHTKRFYIDYLNATAPWMVSWQLRVLNETEININNLEAEFKIGKDWMYITFNGLIIQPPKDEIDFVRFKLYRLFNMISSPYESPREFEKLKITITGASNGTHTVLLYAPSTVPTPNNVSLDYKVMIWQNTTLSSLKDLVFQIARQEVILYLGKNYYVPIFTNSTVSDFTSDFSNPDVPSISFKVSGTTGMGFCNITIPRALIDVKTGNWTVKIDGIPLLPENFIVTQNDEYVFIYLTYSHSDHTIEIVGTWVVVTEFPPNILPPILMILSVIAAIIVVKKRRKLSTLKTKYQSTIHTLAKILHQLET